MGSSLSIRGLTIEFPGLDEHVVAVDGLSLDIDKGEILGVVGESGAGKSSIGSAVIGLLEPPGRVAGGSIELEGKRLPGSREGMREFRGRRIGFIFQDPLSSLDPLFTVGEQLRETLRTLVPEVNAQAEAVRLLDSVGIVDPELRIDDYPHQFSGGMRQRVVIALAMAGKPSLLIADEPTTALDVSVQAQILDLIRGLAREHGISVLLISHDIGVVAAVSNRIVVMKDGKFVEEGETSRILSQPTSDYARRLFSAIPPPDRTIRRFVRFSDSDADDEAAEGRKRRILESWKKPEPVDPLLEVTGINKTFGGGWFSGNREPNVALRGVNLQIGVGESVGLVGESGSGKSTVARIVCGLTGADEGEVLFAGRKYQPGPKPGGIQMIFQDPYSSLNPRLKVKDIVAEPMRMLGVSRSEMHNRVVDLLALTGLPESTARRYPHEFSGGQRQRIAIARALASSPRLLVCDEPTSALDVSVQAQILNLLKDLQEALDLSMLFISHDLPVVRQMCMRIGVLRNGELLELKATDDLFEAPEHPYTRSLLELMPRISPPDNLFTGKEEAKP